jgi:hypothetical protein
MISPVIASYALSLGADELTASLIATLYSMIAIPIFVYGSTARLWESPVASISDELKAGWKGRTSTSCSRS